jgi:hypothetical protein
MQDRANAIASSGRSGVHGRAQIEDIMTAGGCDDLLMH